MATLNTDGMDDFLAELTALADRADRAAKRTVYGGAGTLAEAIRQATLQLPLDDDPTRPYSGPLRVITADDRQDLADCVGLSKMDSDADGVSISASYDGYIRRTERDYPNGVPAAMIVRSIESGSSVRQKNPFFRRAVNGAKDAVFASMQTEFDNYINEIQEG